MRPLFCLFTFLTLTLSPPLMANEPPPAAIPEGSIQEMYDELQKSSIQMQDTYRRLNNPQIKKIVSLLTDKNFTDPLKERLETFNLKEFLIVNLAVLIFFAGFKAWLLSRQKKWYAKLFFSLFMSIVYLGTFSLAIPYFYIGSPYIKILQALFDIINSTPVA